MSKLLIRQMYFNSRRISLTVNNVKQKMAQYFLFQNFVNFFNYGPQIKFLDLADMFVEKQGFKY